LTKVASLAVCFGVLLSGPVMAGVDSVIRDVELTQDGTLYGQVYTPEGQPISSASVQLRYNGKQVATTNSDTKGRFAITGVRGGAHEVTVGNVAAPVRLWKSGTAPQHAVRGLTLAANETVVRGQSYDPYYEPVQGGPTGFGMLDIITLTTVGSAVGGLVIAIDNNNKLDDIEASLPASP
jgi:hypothetical protein